MRGPHQIELFLDGERPGVTQQAEEAEERRYRIEGADPVAGERDNLRQPFKGSHDVRAVATGIEWRGSVCLITLGAPA
jgi:hypothetical protein